MHSIYGLTVGINSYLPGIRRLAGCENDASEFRQAVENRYGKSQVHFDSLVNEQATRENVIGLFRTHLAKAGPNDTVVFYFAGHGAQTKASRRFQYLFPDGHSEGLVLYDSRVPGKAGTADQFDLADKELAILLSEITKHGSHVAVVLDCCHSGSATRAAEDSDQYVARHTNRVDEERPLESYFDGYYQRISDRQLPIVVPQSRHIALTACNPEQSAFEVHGHGLFTSSLCKTLQELGSEISYRDLFDRCRSHVREQCGRSQSQEPQFEPRGGFDIHSGFLGGKVSIRTPKFSVYFEGQSWIADCGTLDGLVQELAEPTELEVFEDKDCTHSLTLASASNITVQNCRLKLHRKKLEKDKRYFAQITRLPQASLHLRTNPSSDQARALANYLDACRSKLLRVKMVQGLAHPANYDLVVNDLTFEVIQVATNKRVASGRINDESSMSSLVYSLQQIAAWEWLCNLQPSTNPSLADEVDFQLKIGSRVFSAGDEIRLDLNSSGAPSGRVEARLVGNNRSEHALNFLLLRLSEDFAIKTVYNVQQAATGEQFAIEINDKPSVFFFLADNEGSHCTERLKLIVSTEKIDGFELEQHGLEKRQAYRGMDSEPCPPPRLGQWFTKDMVILIERGSDTSQ